MAISDVQDGDAGSSVRSKINQLIELVNFFTKVSDTEIEVSGTLDVGTIEGDLNITGNLGINETDPDGVLHLYDTEGPGSVLLKLETDLGTNIRNMTIVGPATDSADDPFVFRTANSFAFKIDDTEVLYVSATGKVGVGQSAPDGQFHINGGTANTDFIMEQDDATNAAKWLIRNNASSGRLTLRNDDNATTPFKLGKTAADNLLKVGTDSDDLLYVGGRLQCKSYTVATLPAATDAGCMIYVSDETGGATMAFSDGTNWRRVQDRAIVS